MDASILEPKVTIRQELIVPELVVTFGTMDTTELQAFAERLNELCNDMKVPPKGKNRQAALAKIFTVSQKGARKWLEAEGWPTVERGVQIAKWGKCSFEWLMTGRGPKRPDQIYWDRHAAKMLAIMEKIPEYLKGTAIDQVSILGDTKPPKH